MSKQDKKQILEQALLAHAALQSAIEYPLEQVLMSKIFGVREPWQMEGLASHEQVKTISSSDALKEELARFQETHLLVPKSCGVTREHIAQLLSVTGNPRLVFLEI